MKMYKTNLFPYIEGQQLVGRGDVVLTMLRVEAEQMPDHRGQEQTKYVLYFNETGKGLVLNKTNTKTIIDVVHKSRPDVDEPDDTDNWAGVKVALYTEKVKAFGEVHDAVRVRDRAIKESAAEKKQKAVEAQKEVDAVNGDLFGGMPDDQPEPTGAYSE